MIRRCAAELAARGTALIDTLMSGQSARLRLVPASAALAPAPGIFSAGIALGADEDRRSALPSGAGSNVFASFFGRGDDKIRDSIAGRLRILGDQAKVDAEGDPSPPLEEESAPPLIAPRRGVGVLVFTAGPRIGETVSLERRSVAFDRDGNQISDLSASGVVASIWEQGPHVMLRDSGGVVVAGSRLTVPVVTLDDGDDIAWGPHRLQFRVVPPAVEDDAD